MGRGLVVGASVLEGTEERSVSAAELLGGVEYTSEQVQLWESDPACPLLLSDFVAGELAAGKGLRRSVIDTSLANAAACCYLIAALQIEKEPKSLFWIVDNVPGITSGKHLIYQVASLGQSHELITKSLDSESVPLYGLTEAGMAANTEAMLGRLAACYDSLLSSSAAPQQINIKEALATSALGKNKENQSSTKSLAIFLLKVLLGIVLVALLAYPIVMAYLG